MAAFVSRCSAARLVKTSAGSSGTSAMVTRTWVDVGRDLREGGPHGIGGAQLRVLAHGPRPAVEGGLHHVGLVAGDDDHRIGARCGQSGQDVVDHRPAGERVQDLGDARPHAGALAGGQDDGGRSGHATGRSRGGIRVTDGRRRLNRASTCAHQSPATATASISTWAPAGRAVTTTVVRPGKGSGKAAR